MDRLHERYSQLATEMIKLVKGLCSEVMKRLFQYRNEIPYNLRQRSRFHIHPGLAAFCGTESITFLRRKIWKLIPGKLK